MAPTSGASPALPRPLSPFRISCQQRTQRVTLLLREWLSCYQGLWGYLAIRERRSLRHVGRGDEVHGKS
ncbi:hypothetical protein L484_013175 [Morus notabilis]|uniref:Uncharacterized protein n=1 Tax=Morus notabilis TaxID=981085 RepID=W9RBX7_9ROSA|nr:hypothetical protein L484_013175 [Morus notabilis]